VIEGLDRLIAALSGAGWAPTVEETRDALWLSTHIAVADQAAPSPEPVASQFTTAVNPPSEPAGRGAAEVVSASETGSTAAELYAAGSDPGGSIRAVSVRSPAVPALRHKAALVRSLRPLKRTTPSVTRFVVDETATAEQIATDGLWLPVLRPAAEKWLDLTLVVDTAASMVVWRRTIEEFRTLTERLGAFRRIRVVELDGDHGGSPTVAAEGVGASAGADPATLIDPAQRQAILIITDGVGVGWREGRIQPYLRQWAQHGSVALATVLPQRMWAGSGLSVVAGAAWTVRPGVPNLQWTVRGVHDVPIPVLGLSARWLRPWAKLVSGSGGRHHTALLADHVEASVSAVGSALVPRSAEDIVGTFRATASPTGFRLACYLSAAWLNLPVMRLVQQLMLPDSDISHLAEVFLGGLLMRVGGQRDADPDSAQYEFAPGVRDDLNNYLSRDELLTVLQRSSEFVAERFGQAFDFAALLADPDGVELPAVVGETGSRPLAHVAASVLAKLGGRYQTLAERLASRPVRADTARDAAASAKTGSAASESTSAVVPGKAEAAPSTVGGYFLGVAVEQYQDPGVAPLSAPVRDALQLADLLGPSYRVDILANPTRNEVREALRMLPDGVPAEASLVLLWAGHMVTAVDGTTRLLTTDDRHDPLDVVGTTVNDLVDACVRTRASQILIILDGNGLDLQRVQIPDADYASFGILTLARNGEAGRDGLFGELLSRAHQGWPAEVAALTGGAFGERIIIEARDYGDEQHPYMIWRGASAPMIPNPAFIRASQSAVPARSDGLAMARVVAVEVVLPGGRIQVGSGYLAAEGLVLTAAHCTRDQSTGAPAEEIRVVQATGDAAISVGADAVIAADSVDIAVIKLPQPGFTAGAGRLLFARVDRDYPGVLEDCTAVGYPLSQLDSAATVQWRSAALHGRINQADGLKVGRLLLRTQMLPGSADSALRGGLSGAVVFYGDRAIGVVVEHHPSQSNTTVQLAAFDQLLDAKDGAAVVALLGLSSVEQLPWVSAGPVDRLVDLVELVSGSDLPAVAELDPYRLGAHKSLEGDSNSYGQADPYVPRTAGQVDDQLDAAIRAATDGGTMVLVVGPSQAGKTRTAFEAIRRNSPHAHLLVPRPGVFAQLAAHPRLNSTQDPIVVWLDDLDRYLAHVNPLTPALLSQLTSRAGPTIVLATMRNADAARFRESGELSRQSRLLLEQAITVHIARTLLDAEESAAAAVYPGRDLASGLAASLAAGPELLRLYDDAQHTDPLQHAAIQVAIDWVRVGRTDPIPETTLARLADELTSTQAHFVITEEEVREAIRRARTPTVGGAGVAALATVALPNRSRGYRPLDYLVAADDGEDHIARPVPDAFWEQALQDADPETALLIGVAARERENTSAAISAYRIAADAGNNDAMAHLGTLFAAQLDPPDLAAARHWLERAADAGNDDAMLQLGTLLRVLLDPPDLAAARHWYQRAAALGNSNAQTNLGAMLQQRGETDEAEAWYRRAAEAGHTLAQTNLGAILQQRGETDEAEA
jgi:tetratricopeptide (TPR) repeat protein